MNRHHPYREQIDACRPGSDDLSLPALADLAAAIETDRELAEEASRAQRFDRAVLTAMHDVPLPAGLADRLLAKLQQAATEHDEPRLETIVASARHASAPPMAAAEVPAPAAIPDRAISRRWLIGAALASAAALLLAFGFWQFNGAPPRQVSEQELAAAGMHWFNEPDNSSVGWTVATVPLPGFPLDPAITRSVRQQKPFRTALGEPAVAYRLSARPKGAVLYVVQTKLIYPVPTIPYKKLGTSGTVSLVAWQRGNLLYVLAVDGDPQQLDTVIKRPRITAISPKFALPPA